MSDIIHLLPDSVANQIAAGEVVQRPASVIKELVENAIDAEAKTVNVLVVDAGKTSIQVIDDGKGMSGTDARLSFERHATSKIRSAADLFALHTMGFRGEALASIAAVAQVELKTRLKESELGTLLAVSGSKVERQEAVACPTGSNFIVKNLFYNVPARRKFLKSNQTELSNILNEFERIALVHPDVEFTLHHNGTEIFNLPAASLRQRVLHVFGKKLNEQLLDIDVDTTLVHLKGYVGKPDTARKKGLHQYFFVNGRYMRHPYFHRAVMEAFDKLVPVGEQVSYFIYFEVDPARIDVNIHPTKTEIKFENEQAIWQIVLAAVKEAIGKFSAVPTIDFDTDGRPDIPVFTGETGGQAAPKPQYNTDFNPFRAQSSKAYARPPVDWENLYAGVSKAEHGGAVPVSDEISPASPTLYNKEDGTSDFADKSTLHYQFKGRYILTSVKSGLMVIDQQRAHIRILYDRFMRQLDQHKGVSQGVLFPEILQLPASHAVVLDSIADELAAVGFDLANLGNGSYSVNGIPSGAEGLNPVELVRNMVDAAIQKGGDVKREVRAHLALSLAQSAAIVPGQVLGNDEMENLVDELFACASPNYTPDGKLVLSIIPEAEFEHIF